MIGFIITILIIYLSYYFWIVFNYDKAGNRKRKSKKKKDEEKKLPVEFEIFVLKYNVDLDKLNYRYFLQFMGLVVSIDLAIVVTIVSYIKTLWLQLLIGFVLVIVITLLSFMIIGKYFKKKGLVKNV